MVALLVPAFRQRRLLGGGVREQQHIRHVLAALAGRRLLRQRGPTEGFQHRENDLGFRNRFVGLAISGKRAEDRLDPGAESSQIVGVQAFPGVGFLDAFPQKILGQQLTLHGSRPVYSLTFPYPARVEDR